MKRCSALVRVLTLSAAVACGCAQSSGGGGGTGGQASGSGGSGTSGGNSGSGGTVIASGGSGTGGKSSAGGATGSGGAGSGGSAVNGGSGAGGGGGRGGSTGTGGAANGGAASGGSTGGTGGTAGAAGSSGAGGAATGGSPAAGGSTGSLPALTVSGIELQAAGKKVVLRGSSLIDIGALYAYFGGASGITGRMDKIAAAGVQGHVVRFPVYPKIDYNAGYSYCSDMPYPVGGTGSGSCTAKAPAPISAADYVSKVLKPAVDYAASKNLYVIIDFHQIDDLTGANNSAADAATFWADVAPKFAGYSNVLFEVFNEPIDGPKTWADIKPKVQTLVDTIRTAGASNVIIVPSNSYCQRPADAAGDPPSDPKKNLMFTAHVYPGNFGAPGKMDKPFQTQLATAVTKAPVFITEWGYILGSSDSVVGTAPLSDATTWGADFQTLVNGNGASWTAWVTDNSWTPNLFSDSNMTTLTDFGTVTKSWLASKAASDWVQ
jgi:hypothetical protein